MSANLVLVVVVTAIVAALVIGRLVIRRIVFTRPPRPLPELDHVDIALLLNVDDHMPVLASLAVLRAVRAIDCTDKGTLTVTGPVPDGGSDTDRAVHAVAARGTAWPSIAGDRAVVAALAAVRENH